MRVRAALAAFAFAFTLAGCAHNNADRSTLRLPVYPHATAVGLSPTVQAKGAGQVLEVFTTWDSFDRVRDWYAGALPRSAQSVVNEKRREATFALFDDRRRTVHLEVSGDQVVIYLSGYATVTGR
ncbi:MAG: hypothetical protein JO293_02280 [Candidatus Eremiobacteraeota bacterium]|nr:hypothetical protein [Candidatus Eremiobacteraeota bacterium]MBV8222164.1 hypothetical protein [Candidatus Eremiobacteraeota bacterium]